MPETTVPVENHPAPSAGRIAVGVTIALVWGAVHWVLFYLFAASGILVDAAIGMVRAFLFPGEPPMGHSLDFAWIQPLQVGLILAGAAGVPLGASLIWRNRRKLLRRAFWVAFLVGAALEVLAVFQLGATAFAP